MGRRIGLFLIVVSTGILIYRFVAPRFTPSAPPPPLSAAPAVNGSALRSSPLPTSDPLPASDPSPAAAGTNAVATARADALPPAGAAIPAPRTRQQQASDELEAQRAPYYRWLREQAANRLSDVRLAADDSATLVLYLADTDAEIVPVLVREVIAPAADRFGFRHVRFFVPDPANAQAPYRYDAEAVADAQGNWHIYKK